MASSHYVSLVKHDPRAANDSGANRLAITVPESKPRCAMRPMTRQAALDTARGAAHLGEFSSYAPCDGQQPCSSCRRHLQRKDQWLEWWEVREDVEGKLWLLGPDGFNGKGWKYGTWDQLLETVKVPPLVRRTDETGTYWVAES